MKPRRIPNRECTKADAAGVALVAFIVWFIHCVLHSLAR
jgi:hypothetical protein